MGEIRIGTPTADLLERVRLATRGRLPGAGGTLRRRLAWAAAAALATGLAYRMLAAPGRPEPDFRLALHPATSMAAPPFAIQGARDTSMLAEADAPPTLRNLQGAPRGGPGTVTYQAPPTLKDGGPQAPPFRVHEWGLIALDVTGAQDVAARLAADLPDFIRTLAGEDVRFSAPPTLKPILYFYPEGTTPFCPDIEVSIPCGRVQYYLPPGELQRADSLFWRHNVFWNRVGDPAHARPVPAGHWIEKARDTDALWLDVTLNRTETLPDGTTRTEAVRETERFLFYDGQIPYVSPLQVERDEGGIRVTHAGTAPIHDLLLVVNGAGGTRIARVPRLQAGETCLLSADHVDAPAERLAMTLQTAGLYEKEANGMAQIWREDLFSREGEWLLWRLDPSTVDAMMPLSIDPAPLETVRVHLVCAPVVTGLRERIAGIVEGFRDPNWPEAAEALEALRRIGPVASAYLATHAGHEDPDARVQVEALLTELGRPR